MLLGFLLDPLWQSGKPARHDALSAMGQSWPETASYAHIPILEPSSAPYIQTHGPQSIPHPSFLEVFLPSPLFLPFPAPGLSSYIPKAFAGIQGGIRSAL